jgi:predicted esterase
MADHDALKLPKSSIYPNPVIIPPLQEHKETWIMLHGRGSNAQKFGSELLSTHIPGHGSLPQAFPHAKFIFPTASPRRATIYKRKEIHQWFDNWHLEAPTEREELQIDGLRETSGFVHDLLKAEIAVVGAKNVVLGGLSQGCAAALVSLLLWEAEPLAAMFGMCGWLPFRKHLQDIAESAAGTGGAAEDDDDPFAQDGKSSCTRLVITRPAKLSFDEDVDLENLSPVQQAIGFLRDELEFPRKGETLPFQQTPTFLGHGTEDDRVPISLGREAECCIRTLGGNTHFSAYEGLGHWYSPELLRDVVHFVEEALKPSPT